ncbi:MAG: prolipoprotein diacylglyceryl transferase, partial [Candidatus Sumerlaeota bacterium]
FGHIGCFLAGCCFGCVVNQESFWHHFAVHYPPRQVIGNQEVGSWAPDAAIFPVQLIESLGNLLIFCLLMWMWGRRRFRGQIFVTYLFAYGVLRFMDEFLRGDERGGFLGLSTSQLLSLIGVAVAFVLWKVLKQKHPLEREEKMNDKKKNNESGEKT